MGSSFALSGRRTAATLSLVTAALVATSVVGDVVTLESGGPSEAVAKVVRMFDLDEENNVPAYFSTVLLLVASALLAVVALVVGRQGGHHRRYWWLLALVFLGLSFDEYASLHEVLIEPVRDRVGDRPYLYFGWVVPGAAFVVVAGLFFLRFLLGLERVTRNRFVVAGVVYVGGVLGVELIEGAIASDRGEQNYPYIAALTVQEAMEMLGIIVFIWALLDHLRRLTGSVDVQLVADPAAPVPIRR